MKVKRVDKKTGKWDEWYSEFFTCPYCQEKDITDWSKYCPNCGKKVYRTKAHDKLINRKKTP